MSSLEDRRCGAPGARAWDGRVDRGPGFDKAPELRARFFQSELSRVDCSRPLARESTCLSPMAGARPPGGRRAQQNVLPSEANILRAAKRSLTGIRTLVLRVRAAYPDQLDYKGSIPCWVSRCAGCCERGAQCGLRLARKLRRTTTPRELRGMFRPRIKNASCCCGKAACVCVLLLQGSESSRCELQSSVDRCELDSSVDVRLEDLRTPASRAPLEMCTEIVFYMAHGRCARVRLVSVTITSATRGAHRSPHR